jgi:membrane fusion protein, copper/silver efflux system
MKQLLVIMAVFASTYTVSAQTTPKKTKADTSHTATQTTTYTCPMHPDVVSNKPGKCPKCGMKLTLSKKTSKQKE